MRIARLGVGRALARKKYKAKRVAAELNQLLSEPEYARQAAETGRLVRSEDGARAAADAIESVLKNRRA